MRYSALAAVFMIGCTSLPSLDEDICGNNILEVGEDCDGATEEGTACGDEGTPNACFFTCEADAQCPEGWVCGNDQRCRRPSANFEAPFSPWRFPVDSFAVGDVDGDGFADLIGNNFSTVTVRYGAADASFSDELDVFIPAPEGRLSFNDLDGDSRTDVVVPIDHGIFALLGTAERTLDPVANALPLDLPDGLALRAVPILTSAVLLGHEVLGVGSDGSGTFFVSINDSDPFVLQGSHALADLQRVTVGKISPVIGVRQAAAVAFRGEGGIFVVSTTGQAASADIGAVAAVSLGTATVAGSAIFADADGDGDLDVVVPAHDGAITGAAIAWNNNGVLASPAQFFAITFKDNDNNDVVAGMPLIGGDLNGDGAADWVTNRGAFLSLGTRGPNLLPFFIFSGAKPTSLDWEEAVIVDINKDDRPDFVVSNTKEQILAVYLNSGAVLFNRVAIGTNVPPSKLRAGEFDGDFFFDVAYVESDPLGLELDKVVVLFGATSMANASQAVMTRVHNVEALEPAYFFFGETIDAVFDLVLTSSDAGDAAITQHSVAVLQGSSTRRMLAPYVFDRETPKSALIGEFNGAGARDVVAVTVPATEADGAATASGTSDIRLLSGVDAGSFVPTGDAVEVQPGDNFGAPCAVWAAGDLNHSGVDELVGFDNSFLCPQSHRDEPPRLVVLSHGTDGPVATYYDVPDDTLRNVSRVQLFDADGDDDLDLVALFRGVLDSSGAQVLSGDGVVVYWNNGIDFVTAISSPVDGADRSLSSVAPINLDTDKMPELVVLRDDGVYQTPINPDDKQYLQPELILDNAGFERFEVGDINGDGLTDLAFVVGGQVDVYLQQPDEPLGTVAAREARGGQR